MERRTFLGTLGLGVLAAPRPAAAQQPGKVYRIGLLDYSAPDAGRQAWWTAFRQRMRELGYVEGQNITFEPRWAQGEDGRIPKLVAELVNLKVDLIVTGGQSAAIGASWRAARTDLAHASPKPPRDSFLPRSVPSIRGAPAPAPRVA